MKERSGFFELCDKISIWLIALFALECVLGSSGQWISFYGFSIRMLLFSLCFLFTLPNVFRQLRSLIRSPYLILAIVFAFYLMIAAVIGWKNGNSASFIIADITGYLPLALMPGFLATVCTENRISHLMNVIFWGTLILGGITAAIHFYLAFASNTEAVAINSWLNDRYMGGLSLLRTGMHRIYMRSQIFLQVGLMIGLYQSWKATGWKRWLYFGAEGVILFGCLISLTRGFWLGFAISALLLLVICPRFWKKYLVSLGAIAAVVVLLFSLSWLSYGKPVAATELTGRFNPALISGTAGDTTILDTDQAAVDMRKETIKKLNENIRKHSVFGNGLGTNLDGLRTDGKTEYMYQDILMKSGVIGFLLFFSVFFLPTILLLIPAARSSIAGKPVQWDSSVMRNVILAVSFLGVGLTSYVNPYLTNPMGILLVLLTATSVKQTGNQLL